MAGTPAPGPPAAPPVPVRTLALYAGPVVGVSFLSSLLLVMYMKFAVDRLAIAPAAMGSIFLISKLWDAVSDPLAGSLSDRTRSRLGRRRSWLLASAVPLGLSAVAMWSPPRALEGPALIAWVSCAVVAWYTAWTAFEVPHLAYGAELTQERGGRIRVFGWRQLANMAGLFAAFSLGATLLSRDATARESALWLSLAVGSATALAVAFTALALPAEPAHAAGRGGRALTSALADVARNPHARRLAAVFFIETAGAGAIGVLAPFVVRYVMNRPALLTPMLLVYVVSSVASVPVWMRLAGRFEKRKLWVYAMLQAGVGFGLLYFVSPDHIWPVIVAGLLAGSAGGCGPTVGQALKADVIDWDEWKTGERKEGAYFAAWNFVAKLASGAMIGTVGVVLDAVGYVPNVEQTEETRIAMRLLLGALPAVGYGCAALLLGRLRFGDAEHARVRAAVAARDPAHRV